MNKSVSGIKLLLGAAGIMWIVQILNILFNDALTRYGIMPRETSHLIGILFAPLLHGGLPHLIGNTIPFIALGFLVDQTKHLRFVTAIVWLGGGLLVWLFGRHSIHIGASGLIMGYFGFLISHAFFTRSLRSVIVTIAAVLLYGGIVISLFDFRTHISFEGHIFGFLTGVLSAWLIGRRSSSR